MKPERDTGVIQCPACKGYDNVALVNDSAMVVWCACGRVYAEQDKGLKEIFDFVADLQS